MKKFSVYRLFEYSANSNRKRIDRNFNTCFSALFEFTDVLIRDKDESRNIVRKALAEARILKTELDDCELIEWLFKKVDAAIIDYYDHRPQIKKVSTLLNVQHMNISKDITKQELLRAFHEEVEKLPKQRQDIIKLFFCGSKESVIAEMVGISKHSVLEEKSKAVEDILNGLMRRGFLY